MVLNPGSHTARKIQKSVVLSFGRGKENEQKATSTNVELN